LESKEKLKKKSVCLFICFFFSRIPDKFAMPKLSFASKSRPKQKSKRVSPSTRRLLYRKAAKKSNKKKQQKNLKKKKKKKKEEEEANAHKRRRDEREKHK
jgi:hypothetical protein